MDLTTDFKSFQDLVQSSLVSVTKTAAQISNQDLSFHRSSSEKVSRSLERQNAHLLRLTNKLLKAATRDTSIKPPTLGDQDDIEDNWRGIVDVVDNLLEKTDLALDEFTGVLKRQSPGVQDAVAPSATAKVAKSSKWGSDSIPKPQLHFDRQVNNAETSPFKPLLQTKPHATIPLEECIGDEESGWVGLFQLKDCMLTFNIDSSTHMQKKSRTTITLRLPTKSSLQFHSLHQARANPYSSIQKRVCRRC